MKKDFYFPSYDQTTTIHGVAWLPEEPPKAVLQIVHGMAEYIERYDAFAKYLNNLGWIVIGHDHLGHGQSVNSDKNYGFFHKESGPTALVSDVYEVTKIIKKNYPDLKNFILGHSMGSFILRNYLKKFNHMVHGAIIMGTGSEKKELPYALSLTKQLNRFQSKKINPLIDKLAFGKFSSYFPETSSSFNWLSKNQDNVLNYEADPLTGFIFTNNGFYTLFQLMKGATTKHWCQTIRADLPLLVISGEKDPVGDFGKGPKKVASELKEHGIQDLTLHLYPALRHEILNEEDNELIMSDLFEWMDFRMQKKQHANL